MTMRALKNSHKQASADRLSSMVILPHLTIKQTLQHMDHFGHRTIFVVNKQKELLGAVADGDMRRWILKDGDLSKAITHIMNKNPISVSESTADHVVKQKMITKEITCIPVVNAGGVIVGIYLWADFFEKESG